MRRRNKMKGDVETTLRIATENLTKDIGDPNVYLILALSEDDDIWIASNYSLGELKLFIHRLFDEHPYFDKIVDMVRLEREIENEVTMGEWR